MVPTGNDLKKLMWMHSQGLIPPLSNTVAAHDKWCAHFKGNPCDCDPDIEVFPAKNAEEWADTFMALNGMSPES
jgi:hypothetical protein